MKKDDWFSEAFGKAVNDIYERVIFEATYGKTPGVAKASNSWFLEGQGSPEKSKETQSQEISRDDDRGVER